jgi:N-acetyl-gamma-glutamyl-phosphate reductase
MTQKIPVAIIGANGYTGIELVRLCLRHPNIKLTAITSRQYAGQALGDVFPHFAGLSNLVFENASVPAIAKRVKCVFLCLPHHESMESAAKFRKLGLKVIDLSADFRFQSVGTYESTYGPHSQKKLLKEAQYGLCEIYSEAIKKSSLIGVPGCYVTSVLLALAPLLQYQMIMPTGIICDSKSGTSGAGRSAKTEQLFAEVNDNFFAYGLSGHRHRPEIEEKLSELAGQDIRITFTPHMLPTTRGILSTIYALPYQKLSSDKLTGVYKKFYGNDPFIKILPSGQSPQIKNVAGTNLCQISAIYDDHCERIIITSALDNLLKGASGQAVQCFNLMYRLEEDAGLTQIAARP